MDNYYNKVLDSQLYKRLVYITVIVKIKLSISYKVNLHMGWQIARIKQLLSHKWLKIP